MILMEKATSNLLGLVDIKIKDKNHGNVSSLTRGKTLRIVIFLSLIVVDV